MTAPRHWFRPTLALLGIALLMVAALRTQGRRWACDVDGVQLWTSDIHGPHNSQHLVDPYAATHMEHGVLLALMLGACAARVSLPIQFLLAGTLEAGWEILENSAWVIDRYRTATAAQGYQGDSILNSAGDLLACQLGFLLATRLSWRWRLASLLAVELVLAASIRDNLALNVLMLVWPLPAVRAWQMGG